MLHCRSELLPPTDLEQIHQTSMQLLANVGVEFPHQHALDIFAQYGAKTDGSKVYLREDQVIDALKTAPAQFTVRARNPERSVTIGGGEPVFVPGYGAPFLVDLEVGKRVPTMDDYHKLARLAHALPNQDLSGHLLVQPGDVPARTAYLHMLQANMLHSDKPFLGSTEGRVGARHTMKMASILFGEKVKDQPVTVGLVNSLSPLSYSSEMLDALMVYARWRQPVVIAALAMAGLTAPVTLAGMLAMQNAELLAGVTLTQLISPGTPVVYGSTSTNVEMRRGTLVVGSPELSLMIAAHAQMAHYYGLPSRGGGSLTDASSVDAQAGFESMFSLLTSVNSDIDLVVHSAGILNAYLAFSYEKFVLDDEMCGMVRHYRQGITVSPETMAYDVIARVGSSGNYLVEPHTVQRCRSEFWKPTVSDREGIEAWMLSGRQDAAHRARQRWQDLLAAHEDPPLDTRTAKQLQAFVEKHTS